MKFRFIERIQGNVSFATNCGDPLKSEGVTTFVTSFYVLLSYGNARRDAFSYCMYAVNGQRKESRTRKKAVRVMEACTARRINFLIFPIIQREENPAMIRQYI